MVAWRRVSHGLLPALHSFPFKRFSIFSDAWNGFFLPVNIFGVSTSFSQIASPHFGLVYKYIVPELEIYDVFPQSPFIYPFSCPKKFGVAFIISLFPIHGIPLLSQVVTGNVPAVTPMKQICLSPESMGEAMAWR